MKTLLDGYAAFYDTCTRIPQQSDSRETTFFADLVPRGVRSVLDIGCAEGKLSVELARRGYDVVASDISGENLCVARKWAQENGAVLSTVCFDAEEGAKPFNGRRFDVVFLNDVVEHFRNPVRALATVRELLLDEGVLFIHTPNCCAPHRLKRYLLQPKKRSNFFDPAQLGDLHFQTYDQMTLEKTLNFTGLEVAEMIPTEFAPYTFRRLKIAFAAKMIARVFPHLADTLLFKCRRTTPIDVEKAIAYWVADPDCVYRPRTAL